MRKPIWIIAVILLVAGCHTKIERAGTTADADAVERSDSRIHVSVTPSEDHVSADNPIELTVHAENVSNEPVFLGHASSTCRLDCLVIVGDRELMAAVSRICTMDSSPFNLDPGESATETLPWDGQVLDEVPRPLAPGVYQVVGLAGHYRSEPVTVEVRGE